MLWASRKSLGLDPLEYGGEKIEITVGSMTRCSAQGAVRGGGPHLAPGLVRELLRITHSPLVESFLPVIGPREHSPVSRQEAIWCGMRYTSEGCSRSVRRSPHGGRDSSGRLFLGQPRCGLTTLPVSTSGSVEGNANQAVPCCPSFHDRVHQMMTSW